MTDLQAIESSEMFTNANTHKRVAGKRYGTVLIGSCKHKDWWYRNLVGIEVFCELIFSNYGYGEFLKDAKAVRLTNTTVIEGRTIDPADIILI